MFFFYTLRVKSGSQYLVSKPFHQLLLKLTTMIIKKLKLITVLITVISSTLLIAGISSTLLIAGCTMQHSSRDVAARETILGKIATSNPSTQLVPAPIVHTLAPLPYDYAALEPVIDTETMKLHHGKHHQAYVDNLNKALLNTEQARLTLEQLFSQVSKVPAAIRNNAGGHFNHTLFWSLMSPVKKSQKTSPSPELLAAINSKFGSLEGLKEAINSAALSRFGSGWAWLVKTPNGLEVTSTANQDNPLMDTAEVKGQPLLALDVWEHAYYLKYKNRRPDYVKAWWSLVNWGEVSKRFSS